MARRAPMASMCTSMASTVDPRRRRQARLDRRRRPLRWGRRRTPTGFSQASSMTSRSTPPPSPARRSPPTTRPRRGPRMPATLRIDGLDAELDALTALPTTLRDQAAPLVRSAADEAEATIRAAYPVVSGALRDGLRQETVETPAG